MSHESVPLAYEVPARASLSAPVRWTLIVWASLVLIRHGLYWTGEAMHMLDWKGANVFSWINVTPMMFAFMALTIETVGLLTILFGALGRTDRSIRRMGIGSVLVLIALVVSLGLVVIEWTQSWNFPSLRVVTWQIISKLTACAPVLLALLGWREYRSATSGEVA